MTQIITTTSRLLPRAELSSEHRAAMHRLLARHFEGVTADQFHRDLSEKNWVILIERDRRIVGFTTLLAYETSFDGEPLSVIYSGDTIVSPQAWNTCALPRGWIESVVGLRRRYPRGRYVWLLITSGFRTYRLLPVFWREFHPRYDAAIPADAHAMLEHLAAERFGHAFDPSTGIVRLPHPQRLHGGLAEVPESRTDDPHVAFFLARNPGYARGDELACITELTPANLTAAGRRMASATPTW
jgi:hypothetical protein